MFPTHVDTCVGDVNYCGQHTVIDMIQAEVLGCFQDFTQKLASLPPTKKASLPPPLRSKEIPGADLDPTYRLRPNPAHQEIRE